MSTSAIASFFSRSGCSRPSVGDRARERFLEVRIEVLPERRRVAKQELLLQARAHGRRDVGHQRALRRAAPLAAGARAGRQQRRRRERDRERRD